MKNIKLDLDYLSGPIWGEIYSISLHKSITGIQIIDNDNVAQELNNKIQDLYLSCYEFNGEGQTCVFNDNKKITIKPQILLLVKELKDRLHMINDGSFEIEDLITPDFMKI